ncbi:hypothetical protein [Actinoallomurus sp. CA-142502]|uniref:hypothetical protein n=1 Tax=Actinoallomurus sp. CA-142502 TaxID=3239885 RepID=UPI003D93C717
MGDGALWIAALTGGTAVLASWVTSRGNTRAARVQAEASAHAQHRIKAHELRRTAYLQLIEQAHLVGELYWRLGDVYAQLTDPVDQLARIEQLRADLRNAFDPLSRCVRVVVLEGPPTVADAAEHLRQATMRTNRALSSISQGQSDARERFDDAHRFFRASLEHFIEAARNAIAAPSL